MTETQKRILNYIKSYTTRNWHQPTKQEIAKHIGLSSPSSVNYHLEPLLANGLVKFKGPRAIVDTNNKINFVEFANDILEIIWNGNGIDEETAQELGIKHGLLKEVVVTKPCGENCNCELYSDFPATCYQKTYA